MGSLFLSFGSKPSTDSVFIFAGQSNARANGAPGTSIPSNLQTPNAQVKIWNVPSQTWQTYAAGTNSDSVTAGEGSPQHYGPEGEFAQQYLAAHPSETFYIVKYAQHGAYLAQDGGSVDWSPSSTGEYFALAKAEIIAAMAALVAAGKNPTVKTLFWLQGENDAWDVSAYGSAYGTNLAAFFAAARSQWATAGTPIVLHHISDSTDWAYRVPVRAAQLSVVNADGNASIVSTDAYTLAGDNEHYIAADIATFGQDLFKAYAGTYNPLPTDITVTWRTGFAAGSIPKDTIVNSIIADLTAANSVCGGTVTFAETVDADNKIVASAGALILNGSLAGDSVSTTHAFTLRVTNTLGRTFDKASSLTVAAAAATIPEVNCTYAWSQMTAAYSGASGDGAGLRDGTFVGNTSVSANSTTAGLQYLYADLGSVLTIDHILLAPITASFGDWGAQYANGCNIHISNDASSWTSKGAVSGLSDGGYGNFPINATGRYVRLSRTGGYVAFGDFRVFAN